MNHTLLALAVIILAACTPVEAPTSTTVADPNKFDTVHCTVGEQLVWYHIGTKLDISDQHVDAETGEAVYDISENGQPLKTVQAANLVCNPGFKMIDPPQDTNNEPAAS